MCNSLFENNIYQHLFKVQKTMMNISNSNYSHIQEKKKKKKLR